MLPERRPPTVVASDQLQGGWWEERSSRGQNDAVRDQVCEAAHWGLKCAWELQRRLQLVG
jgi:hypothetical protein